MANGKRMSRSDSRRTWNKGGRPHAKNFVTALRGGIRL